MQTKEQPLNFEDSLEERLKQCLHIFTDAIVTESWGVTAYNFCLHVWTMDTVVISIIAQENVSNAPITMALTLTPKKD